MEHQNICIEKEFCGKLIDLCKRKENNNNDLNQKILFKAVLRDTIEL